jgi:CheY-like chemotaxis protein
MQRKPILLAEDRADDQLLVKRALKHKNIGNPLLIANDGVEALDFLFGTGARAEVGPIKPAVVLLDLKMPRIDGLEVLQRVRENPATRNLPIVMMTSSDEEKDLVRSYDLGVNSYIRKPVDFSAFADAIAQIGLYWLLLNKSPD